MSFIVELSERGERKLEAWLSSVSLEEVHSGAVEADLCHTLQDLVASGQQLVYELDASFTKSREPETLMLDATDILIQKINISDHIEQLVSDATDSANAARQAWSLHGENIGSSRWFYGAPTVVINEAGQMTWICPVEGCGGEMEDTGEIWMSGDPGFHHQCNSCSFKAAITGAIFRPRSYST